MPMKKRICLNAPFWMFSAVKNVRWISFAAGLIVVFSCCYLYSSDKSAVIQPHVILPQAIETLPDNKLKLVGNQLRQFYRLFYSTSGVNDKVTSAAAEIFPWMKHDPYYFRDFYKGTGIIICASDMDGSTLARHALTLVRSIRYVYNSNIPIELMYIGDKDLSIAARLVFSRIPGVSLVDIYERAQGLIDFGRFNIHGGFNIKPLALLVSSFRHSMLADADTVLLTSPETFFRHPSYIDFGSMLFQDRSLVSDSVTPLQVQQNFLASILSDTAAYSHLDMIRGISTHEQESGVVVLDKFRHIIPVLTLCRLMQGDVRDKAGMYGDKEFFWLAFATLDVPFKFLESQHVGSIGASKNIKVHGDGNYTLCSYQIAHVDDVGELMWMNGAITLDRKDHSSSLGVFEVYSDQIGGGTWSNYCLTSRNVPRKVRSKVKHYLAEIGNIYKQTSKDLPIP